MLDALDISKDFIMNRCRKSIVGPFSKSKYTQSLFQLFLMLLVGFAFYVRMNGGFMDFYLWGLLASLALTLRIQFKAVKRAILVFKLILYLRRPNIKKDINNNVYQWANCL